MSQLRHVYVCTWVTSFIYSLDRYIILDFGIQHLYSTRWFGDRPYLRYVHRRSPNLELWLFDEIKEKQMFGRCAGMRECELIFQQVFFSLHHHPNQIESPLTKVDASRILRVDRDRPINILILCLDSYRILSVAFFTYKYFDFLEPPTNKYVHALSGSENVFKSFQVLV